MQEAEHAHIIWLVNTLTGTMPGTSLSISYNIRRSEPAELHICPAHHLKESQLTVILRSV